ncbi:MAG: ABC transporter permease [Kiritimatiellia bacterium]
MSAENPETATESADRPVKVYTPDAAYRVGFHIWGEMIRDMAQSRDLIWRLFLRQWVGQFRQTWLGYFWAVFPTIVAVAAFVLLRRNVLPKFQTAIPYVAYAMWGMSAWQLFATTFQASMNALQEGGNMVARINFPKESLVFASIGKCLFSFLLRLAVFAAVVAWYYLRRDAERWDIPWTVVIAPAALLPLVFLAIGSGMIFAVLMTVAGDVGPVVPMALQFGVFVTPGVMFPAIDRWPFVLLGVLNPVSAVIEGSQGLLATGRLTHPDFYAVMSVMSVLVFLIGWRFLRLAMPRIAERF